MKTQPFIHAKASRARGRGRLWSSAPTTSVGALTVTSCKQAGFVCDTACFFCVYNVHPRKALPPQPRHSPYHVVLLHFHAHFRSRFVLRADWPRACCWSANTMHRYAFISTLSRRPSMLTRAPDSLQRSIASRRSRPRDPPPYPSLTSLPLVPRQSNVSCAALEAQGNVNTSTIESMNPGVNCTSLPPECVVQHTDERGPFSPTL